jgi:hypothetical protein
MGQNHCHLGQLENHGSPGFVLYMAQGRGGQNPAIFPFQRTWILESYMVLGIYGMKIGVVVVFFLVHSCFEACIAVYLDFIYACIIHMVILGSTLISCEKIYGLIHQKTI